MKADNKIFTISNGLSAFRLLLALPIWYALDNYHDAYFQKLALILCLIAAATDYLDGHYARKRNEITELGKIIDPLADKILIGLIAIKLYLNGEVSGYFVLIILLRDLIIFIGGVILSIKLKRVLPSNRLGKITVTVIGIVFLFIIGGFNKNHVFFGFLYYLSILLVYASLVGYLIRAIEFIKKSNQNEHLQQSA